MARIALIASLFCLCISAYAGKTTVQRTGVEYSQNSKEQTQDHTGSNTEKERERIAKTEAERWSIEVSDWHRYKELSEGIAKYDYAHLDPVMVLGIFARNETERTKFARLYVKQEQRRVQGLLDFDRAFQREAILLAKRNGQSVVDENLFYRNSPKARVERTLNKTNLKSNDRLALFVNTTCPQCHNLFNVVDKRRKDLDVGLDIYFVGNVSDDEIRHWAEEAGIKPKDVHDKKITLNHDKGASKRFKVTEIPSVFVREGVREGNQ